MHLSLSVHVLELLCVGSIVGSLGRGANDFEGFSQAVKALVFNMQHCSKNYLWFKFYTGGLTNHHTFDQDKHSLNVAPGKLKGSSVSSFSSSTQ